MGLTIKLILYNLEKLFMVNIDCNNGLQLFFVGLLKFDALQCLFEKYSLVSENPPTHGAWEKVQAFIERRGREMLRGQSQELKAVLTKREEEFPYPRLNLKKVKALLPPSTV